MKTCLDPSIKLLRKFAERKNYSAENIECFPGRLTDFQQAEEAPKEKEHLKKKKELLECNTKWRYLLEKIVKQLLASWWFNEEYVLVIPIALRIFP